MSFAILASAGGGPNSGPGGTTSDSGSWISDIPIIGALLDFLAESSEALLNGSAALWKSKDLFLDSVSWLHPAIWGILGTVILLIITLKLFGR